VVNVPTGIWVDEQGVIVRPPEPAWPWVPRAPSEELIAQLPPLLAEMLREAQKLEVDPEPYLAALRDWVARGAESPFALSPEEVVARSAPRDAARARAAACFELGQYLYRNGAPDDAVRWFREAHELQPENWTYKRQAWTFADPFQGPNEVYDSDWLSEVRRVGPENYYPPVSL
jgi:tetratricopeptide (TPR) repeat protein